LHVYHRETHPTMLATSNDHAKKVNICKRMSKIKPVL
jgi:hypothetical protein